MCGIVAYIGGRNAADVIVKGLKRLEYRGYDSAGIALLDKGLNVYKKQGKVADLQSFISSQNTAGNVGIGHTRWATHGAPSDVNAHPHTDGSGRFALVHNGIIENYGTLKEQLETRGHVFKSETDSEVLAHLIEDIVQNENVTLAQAVRMAIQQVVGAYAIVVIDQESPDQLIAARKGSPLVIGIGEQEFFFASDATPIIEYTNEVVYLDDYEIAVVSKDQLKITSKEDVPQTPYIQTLEMEMESIEKGGYDHFMLKEIYEQPRSISDCMRGRVSADDNNIHLGGMIEVQDKLLAADRIIIIACGTSWHAGLVAEYVFEEFARIPVEVEYASEFRYRNPIIKKGDVVIAISQSGETADTLAALELAKERGATILGVCNVVGASIPRATHAGVYTHAGTEVGVASTKAFTAQVTALTMMALQLAHKRGTITDQQLHNLLAELERVPSKVEEALQLDKDIEKIAHKLKDSDSCLYLGRGYNFPVALEGALKLKEISYIYAEGYAAGEMKHGPIALIDEAMPVVAIATRGDSYDKMVSNIQEVKARKGIIIAVVSQGDTVVSEMADYTIEVPDTEEMFMPLVATIPLQLLSYHIALMKGCNVDQPRNLAKSVTVE